MVKHIDARRKVNTFVGYRPTPLGQLPCIVVLKVQKENLCLVLPTQRFRIRSGYSHHTC